MLVPLYISCMYLQYIKKINYVLTFMLYFKTFAAGYGYG